MLLVSTRPNLYDLYYLNELLQDFCDPYGGFSLYWHGELIAHLFYLESDFPRTFFHVLCESVTPEMMEELFEQDILHNKNCFLINHLTGTVIPSSRLEINHGFMVSGFQCIWLSISIKEQSFFTWMAGIPKYIAAFLVFSFSFSLQSFLRFPTSLSKACEHFLNLWSERYKSILDNHVKNFLATQNKAVVDLRRGKFGWAGSKGSFQHLGTDESDSFTTKYCPLKKDFLEHINEITLALPSESFSAYYQALLTCINPDKVVELVIFNPSTLDDYYIYNNIQKICLIDIERDIDMAPISKFQKLKKIYVVYEEGKMSTDIFCNISNDIQLEIVCIKKYSQR